MRKLRVKVLCVQALRVPKLCVESQFPKRRGGEQGGFRQSQGRESRRISPCCHTRLEIERRPQAHTTASSRTPGQRGDRRHHVGLLGTGTQSKTKNKPELTGTCDCSKPCHVLWEPPAGRCPRMLQFASCAPTSGMCPARRVSPLPLPSCPLSPQAHMITKKHRKALGRKTNVDTNKTMTKNDAR